MADIGRSKVSKCHLARNRNRSVEACGQEKLVILKHYVGDMTELVTASKRAAYLGVMTIAVNSRRERDMPHDHTQRSSARAAITVFTRCPHRGDPGRRQRVPAHRRAGRGLGLFFRSMSILSMNPASEGWFATASYLSGRQ